ncbi:hypothetical protein ACHAPJ_007487 [Fusarium lateritium]
MQFSIVALAFFASAGTAVSIRQSDPFECVDGGFFYGMNACMQMCKGGTCTISEGHENDPDYICGCDNPNGPGGCGEMVKGKEACEDICTEGTCFQLLIPHICKCP